MCIKDVLWNLTPTCWMAAKFGSARTFCCFTPSAQFCIQFLNVHKNCKTLKMPDWSNKNFESHSATVLGFFNNSLGAGLKILVPNILKFRAASFYFWNFIFLSKTVSVKCKANGYFVAFRNPCRRQREMHGWMGSWHFWKFSLGQILCHLNQWSGPTLRVF